MPNDEYGAEQIGPYGAQVQPAVAASMAPHLRMTMVGTGAAVLAVVCAVAGVVLFPASSAEDTGVGWAVATLVCTVVMLAVCLVQVATWRRAMASWRGAQVQDLHAEARLSWIAHLSSYGVALLVLLFAMLASAAAGWSGTAATLLSLSLLFAFAAQVLAGVQYLRPSGPPGTVPAHLRRMVRRAQEREDARAAEEDRAAARAAAEDAQGGGTVPGAPDDPR